MHRAARAPRTQFSRIFAASALWAMVFSCQVPALAQAGGQQAGGQQAGPAPAAPPDGSVGGMGDVNLYPKRLVIDDRQRIGTVGLYNKSSATGDYEIAVNDMMMMPDGKLVNFDEVTDPAQKARVRTASAMLRWSPRRVALRGNEAQIIRIMARTPPGIEPGEYRSHFLAISVPPAADVGNSIDSAVAGSSGTDIGVRIVPRFGISIPIILRVGETMLTTGLRGLRLVNLPGGGRALALTITRQGTRSAFGDVTVTARGASAPVALARGVGVYPEVDSRDLSIPVDPAVDARLLQSGATLTVTYTDDDFKPGAVLSRQDFVLP